MLDERALHELVDSVRQSWKDRQLLCSTNFNRVAMELLTALQYTFDGLRLWSLKTSKKLTMALSNFGPDYAIKAFARWLQTPVASDSPSPSPQTYSQLIERHDAQFFVEHAVTCDMFKEFPDIKSFWASLEQDPDSRAALWDFINQLRLAATDWADMEHQRTSTTPMSFDVKDRQKFARMSAAADAAFRQGCNAEEVLAAVRNAANA